MADTYELDEAKNMVAAENGVTESQLQTSLEPINSQINSLSSILSTLTSTVEMLQKFTENIMPLNWARLPDMLDYQNPVDIAYGGDKWLAVGASKAAYSYDGLTWTPLTLSIPSIGSMVYGNGKFIIQSSDTDIFYSENGLNWTSVPNIISEGRLLSLSFTNGKFFITLIVNGDSSIMYSDDGLVWNRSNINFEYPIYSITYGNGLYVAGTGSKNFFYSSDLITWTRVIIDTGTNAESLGTVAFGNGIFVAGGGADLIYYSSNGINWTKYEGNEITSPHNYIRFITFANGKFIIGSSGGIYYTVHPANGINFIDLDPGTTYYKRAGLIMMVSL